MKYHLNKSNNILIFVRKIKKISLKNFVLPDSILKVFNQMRFSIYLDTGTESKEYIRIRGFFLQCLLTKSHN